MRPWARAATLDLAGEMFKAAANDDMLHVPYKGGAPALFAVIGGQVAVGFIASVTVIESIKAGKVTALAVSGSKTIADVPGVPHWQNPAFRGLTLICGPRFLSRRTLLERSWLA